MILVLHSSRLPGHVPGSWRGWDVIFSGFSLFQSSANTALHFSFKRNSIFGGVKHCTTSLSYRIYVKLSLCLSKMQIARKDETSNLPWKLFFFFSFVQNVSFRISSVELNVWIELLLVFSVSPTQLHHDHFRLDPSKFIVTNARDYRYIKHKQAFARLPFTVSLVRVTLRVC